MQSEPQRLNSLRLLVARVRDKRLERLMERVRRQRDRCQTRSRERMFAAARRLARAQQHTQSAA